MAFGPGLKATRKVRYIALGPTRTLTGVQIGPVLAVPHGRRSALCGKGFSMSVSFEDVGNDLRRIMIVGRLDMEGTDSLSPRIMELAEAPKKGVIIDLSAVRFLASVGIRVLVACAKAVQQRGGKLVVVVAQGSSVSMSLNATGVDELIPVFTNIAEAGQAALQ